MANYKSLKTTINANVKRNGNQEITGQILNSVLNAMVDTLGTGYSFAGVATPSTNPGTPDAKVFYIANGKGTYTDFGGLEVTEDEVVVLYWDSLWHKESTGIAREENLINLRKDVDTKQNALTDTDGGYGQRVAELEKEGIASQEKLTELSEILGLSNNEKVNQYIETMYLPEDVDTSLIYGVQVKIAANVGGTIYNIVYLRGYSNGVKGTVFSVEQRHSSIEDALKSWNSGQILKGTGYGFKTKAAKDSILIVDEENFKLSNRDFHIPFYPNIGALSTGIYEINANMPVVNKSVNLLDIKRAQRGYVTSTGIVSTYPSYRYSHPIFVQKGKSYKQVLPVGLGGNKGYCRCDEKGTPFLNGGTYIQEGDFAIYTPEFTGFILVNLGSTKREDLMFTEYDLYPEEFQPYEELLPNAKVEYHNILNIPQSQDSILIGKIIAFDGDSICAGAGKIGGYGKIIAERNGMTYQNLAVGGGTIRTGTYSSSGAARHWISESVLNLREDADYIIVEGGVNDDVTGEFLGEFSPYYTDDFDSSTFYGAMDTLCKNLYERFPGKKVGFIVVHAVYGWSAARETEKYVAVTKVLNKWGIPYLDLNKECPPFGLLPSDSHLVKTYTKPLDSDASKGDGWHPNEEGYKKYYCDKIEAWLKTL